MQKMIKKYRKAKGFTLVELLIVIIIIGILAGMMMLSTGSATDKAEATKILSDMRNIKSAALMYYADNGKWPTTDNSGKSLSAASLDKYLDSSPTGSATYTVMSADNVKMRVKATSIDSKVGEKLKQLGVVSMDSNNTTATMDLK